MKFIKTNYWCYSHDGESFYECDDAHTKEEAVRACIESEGGYIGRAVELEFDENDFNCEIGYKYGELLYDEIGDASENWELPNEHEVELNKKIGKLIADYLTEHNLQPTCYKVVDIEEVEE